MAEQGQGPAERALNRAVELGIENTLQEVESVEVNVRTDPLKAIAGKADSVSVQGQGLVIDEQLRVEALEVQSDGLAVDPLAVLFGRLKLRESVNTTARVVLTEADLNRLLASSSVRGNLQNLVLRADGQTVNVAVDVLQIHLHQSGRLQLTVELLHESGRRERLTLAATPCPGERESSLCLQDVRVQFGQIALALLDLKPGEDELAVEAEVHFDPESRDDTSAGVDIRSGSLAFARIRLSHVERALARVLLPLAGVNGLLASPWVQGNLQMLSLQLGERSIAGAIEQLAMRLQPDLLELEGIFCEAKAARRTPLKLQATTCAGSGALNFLHLRLGAATLAIGIETCEVKAGKLTLGLAIHPSPPPD
ncbi:MAG: DUF2993 domain-containing protein [Aphanocapsa lilacina HA4352-LM1]|nr:DUF2993 domain-containing protein [Aphanocapsa lilacina HA4352-LM1]